MSGSRLTRGRIDSALLISLGFHAVLMGALALKVDWRPSRPAAGAAPVSIKARAIDQGAIDEQRERLEAARLERELAAQREREREDAQRRAEAERLAELEREAERQREAEQERLARIEREAEEVRRREEAREAEQARILEEQRQAEERRRAEEARKAEEARLEEERRAAEAARKAEERRKEEARRRAEEAARREREALLAESMQRELDRAAAVNSGLLDEYRALITQKIRRNWNRPGSASDDLKCIVEVRQIPGGVVRDVNVKSCNGDAAVVRSIEAAIYKASPLPRPPDPSLFERVLEVTFVP